MNKSEGARRSCDQNFSGIYRLAKGEPALLRRELTLNTNADGIRFLDISDNIAKGSYFSEAKGPEGRSESIRFSEQHVRLEYHCFEPVVSRASG